MGRKTSDTNPSPPGRPTSHHTRRHDRTESSLQFPSAAAATTAGSGRTATEIALHQSCAEGRRTRRTSETDEMKDADLLSSAPGAGAAADVAGLFGKGRYKFWALVAILLLAFWSMFTGTVTLKWSAGNLNRVAGDLDAPIHDDLDVLEMEEREKVVRHMWDVYTHSQRIQLPRFWQEAFEAAYEELASVDPAVRDAAVSEIAKMSIRIADLDPPPAQHSKSNAEKNDELVRRTKAKSSSDNQ